MLGNVLELVEDWDGDYPGGTVTDPQGPPSGSDRVMRGGSHFSRRARFILASARIPFPPDGNLPWIGFRLLRTE